MAEDFNYQVVPLCHDDVPIDGVNESTEHTDICGRKFTVTISKDKVFFDAGPSLVQELELLKHYPELSHVNEISGGVLCFIKEPFDFESYVMLKGFIDEFGIAEFWGAYFQIMSNAMSAGDVYTDDFKH